jgi:drug/metabolite transporter (DMT)-like permease
MPVISRGSLYVMSAIFLWSSLGVVIRLSGVDVHLLLFYSVLISTTILSFVVFRPEYRSRLPRGRGLVQVLFLGPVTLLNTFTFFYALKNTTISNALMTHYIAPVLVAFMAFVFLKEELTWTLVLALMLSSIGLWVLLDMSLRELLLVWQNPSSDALGIMSGLTSGLAYAILILLGRVFAQDYDPVVLTFMSSTMMCLLLLPFVREFPVHGLWSFLVVGIVHSTVAPILYFKGLNNVFANQAAVLGYLEPVCAILFAMLVLSEYPSQQSILGGGLIILSGYVTIRYRRAGEEA